MAGNNYPGPAGGSTGTTENAEQGIAARTTGQLPGPIISCPGIDDGLSWTMRDIVKWKLLPAWLGGDRDILRRYKDLWVTTHASTIKRMAMRDGLPPVLLAGVVWIEVGGDPDFIDRVAYSTRKFDHLADPILESMTVTKKPEMTSFGEISIQLRRAAETLGFDPNSLSSENFEELSRCLESNERFNIDIVSQHLAQLKRLDFSNTEVNEDTIIRITGTRYNRGPNLSGREIERNTAYGDFILGRKRVLVRLLANG